MKTIGIMSGLGPLAGAHFLRRIIELTPAQGDDEHLPVVLVSEPRIPSRLRHLEGLGESPVAALQQVANRLVLAGAEAIAIPSSTAHIYVEDIAASVPVPVVNMIGEVVNRIVEQGCRSIALLATTPTRTFGVYDPALTAAGVRTAYPDEESQREVMEIIGLVKGHRVELAKLGERLSSISDRTWARMADGLLLACTETPIIFPKELWSARHSTAGRPLFDATDILAEAVIRWSAAD